MLISCAESWVFSADIMNMHYLEQVKCYKRDKVSLDCFIVIESTS